MAHQRSLFTAQLHFDSRIDATLRFNHDTTTQAAQDDCEIILVDLLQSTIGNRLLSHLSANDFAAIAPNLARQQLVLGTTLVQPDEVSETVYFPCSGLLSQIAVTREGKRLEVGLYGRDGMGPVGLVLGVDQSPHQLLVQAEGEALAMPAGELRAALSSRAGLRDLFLRFLQVHMTQTAYTAVSNRTNVIGERLARWILMSQDRVDGADLPLTHEFLSVMLGVRRSGVTDAIHVLEGARVIKATRGNIRVLDRTGLESLAGDSYGIPEAEYRRLIGPL